MMLLHISLPDRSHERRKTHKHTLAALCLKVHEQGAVRIARHSSLIVDYLRVLLEIAGIAWVHTWWNNRRAHCLVQQSLPIHAPEPFMVLDVIRSTLKVHKRIARRKRKCEAM
jgi:hypothetical protein